MPRVRDYAAEYARRKALHPGNLPAARGHKRPQEERTRASARRYAKKLNVSGPDLHATVENVGWWKTQRILAQQNAARKEYLKGNKEPGRRMWDLRDPELPDSLFYYHDMFG